MNCYGKTDIFFTKKKFREAKELCRSCPKLKSAETGGSATRSSVSGVG